MKKSLGMMVLGLGVGASSVLLYDKYKSGDLDKLIKKTSKEVNKLLEDM